MITILIIQDMKCGGRMSIDLTKD